MNLGWISDRYTFLEFSFSLLLVPILFYQFWLVSTILFSIRDNLMRLSCCSFWTSSFVVLFSLPLGFSLVTPVSCHFWCCFLSLSPTTSLISVSSNLVCFSTGWRAPQFLLSAMRKILYVQVLTVFIKRMVYFQGSDLGSSPWIHNYSLCCFVLPPLVVNRFLGCFSIIVFRIFWRTALSSTNHIVLEIQCITI